LKRVMTFPESFWTLAVDRPYESIQFMHWKDHGASGCYIAVGDPANAERFGSYLELRRAMKRDSDVRDFIEYYPHAVPAKITRKTEVYLHGHVAS